MSVRAALNKVCAMKKQFDFDEKWAVSSVAQISREINFGQFRDVTKLPFLPFLERSEFGTFGTFHPSKSAKIHKS